MTRYLPDTNIISHLMRGDRQLHSRVERAHEAGDEILLSPMVVYEVKRGLLAKNAVSQTRNFERLALKLHYLEFDRATWEKAAELWMETREQGAPIADADLLIAAQAVRQGAVLVTNNERHFLPFGPLGLRIEDWTK